MEHRGRDEPGRARSLVPLHQSDRFRALGDAVRQDERALARSRIPQQERRIQAALQLGGLLPDQLAREPFWVIGDRDHRPQQLRFEYTAERNDIPYTVSMLMDAPLGVPTVFDMEVFIWLAYKYVRDGGRARSPADGRTHGVVAFTHHEMARGFGHTSRNIGGDLLERYAQAVSRLRLTTYHLSRRGALPHTLALPALSRALSPGDPDDERVQGNFNLFQFEQTIESIRYVQFADVLIEALDTGRMTLIDFRQLRALRRDTSKRLLVFLASQRVRRQSGDPDGFGSYAITIDHDLAQRLGADDRRRSRFRGMVAAAVRELSALCRACYRLGREGGPGEMRNCTLCGAAPERQEHFFLESTVSGRGLKVVYRRADEPPAIPSRLAQVLS